MTAAIGVHVTAEDRKKKVAALRFALEPYRGGRFETAESGGAGGMMFFRDAQGKAFYIGGFCPRDAEHLVRALNLTMDLLGGR